MIVFYILVFTLPMPNHPLWAAHVGPFTILKLIGMLGLLIALFEMARTGVFPVLSKYIPSGWYLLYFLAASVSVFRAKGLDAFEAPDFWYILSGFCLFTMTAMMVSTAARLRRVVLLVLASIAMNSLYVAREWQAYHNFFPGFRTWGGKSDDPNYFAVAVVLWVPLTVFWLLGKRPKWETWFCIGCIGVMLVGFTLAASRGGLIGLSVAMLFLLMHVKHRLKILALVALLALPMSLLPGTSALDRLINPTSSDQESSEFRLELWQAARQNFIDHPVFGIGLGKFAPQIVKDGIIIQVPFHVAHNTYMDVAANMGLSGLIPFVGVLIGSVFTLRKVVKRATAPEDVMVRQVALGLQAGILGYMICAFFLSTLWLQVFWLCTFLTMSLPRVLHLSHAPVEEQPVLTEAWAK
jgi:O-antigen ligase